MSSSYLDALLFGYRTVLVDGAALPHRAALDIIGAHAVDNPVTGRTELTLGSRRRPPQLVTYTGGAPVQIDPRVSVVLVDTTGGPVVLYLPATGMLSGSVLIKDHKGTAGTSNISVRPAIGGYMEESLDGTYFIGVNKLSAEFLPGHITYVGGAPKLHWFAVGY